MHCKPAYTRVLLLCALALLTGLWIVTGVLTGARASAAEPALQPTIPLPTVEAPRSVYLPLIAPREVHPQTIAFAANSAGTRAAFVVSADGANLRRLTDNERSYDPQWSPDGTQVAFLADRDGSSGLYVIGSDGDGERRLASCVGYEPPQWSPDGQRIAFVEQSTSPGSIYTVNVNGTDLKQLTDDGDQPRWSPDGNRIVFTSARTGRRLVYVMNADGSDQALLTPGYARAVDPCWSPDGLHIAYAGNRNLDYAELNEIYVMGADGSGQTRLIGYGSSECARPLWSPDGSKIAFVHNDAYSSPHGGINTNVMDADGTHVRVLLAGGRLVPHYAWSPDSRHLAIARGDAMMSRQLYVVAVDGSSTRCLNTPTEVRFPSWQPATRAACWRASWGR